MEPLRGILGDVDPTEDVGSELLLVKTGTVAVIS